MKKSTKILIVITLLFLVANIVLTKYILQGVVPTENGFTFSFSTLGIIGLVVSAIFGVLSTILFVKFIKSQKLVGAIFFSVMPLTVVYGAFIVLSTEIKDLSGTTAQAVRATLNLNQGPNYISYLWSVLATIIYLALLFVILFVLCNPLAKVEKVAKKLGDGRIKQENYHVGGGKQFKEIEHSLNRINYNIKQQENKLRQVDFSKQKNINKNFYKFLGKNSVLELECGNPVKKETTLMLCELKDLSEDKGALTLKENYQLLSSYLKIVAPFVVKHNGFVDKYLGEGLLAVFPSGKDAIECAHAILKAVKAKNKTLKIKIDTTIAIHSSAVTFGLVGEEKMPSIVSNELDLLSQMQDKNVLLGTKILISKDVLNTIKQNFAFDYRFVCMIDKNYFYESLACYQKRKRDKLKKMKNKVESGVQMFYSNKFEQAKDYFSSVLRYVPDDNVSFVYFNQATEKLKDIA